MKDGNQTEEPTQRRGTRDRGASLVEYALLLALIAVVCITAVSLLGTNLETSVTNSANSIVSN